MAEHTDELRRSWLRRRVAMAWAMVTAIIDDWGVRLEKWAKEGVQ
jgi:hypothetical protein